jgi:asparagine N-glycosylation enzyme membrane subunit Stt3
VPARALDHLIVLAIVLAALFVRVEPAYDRVMVGQRVIFASNDPWIHMRNADNVAAHWPAPSWFDPYRLAPEGQETDAPLMDIAIAGVALATTIPLDIVGAWFPAVAGSLVVVPVFWLMRRRFGRPEAVIAALLVALLPGHLLQRSVLGHTDHHVLEALLAATVLALMARAVESWRSRDAIVTGVFLGFYLLTWSRGVFLVLILLAWAFVELAFAARRFQITRLMALVFLPAFVLTAPVALQLRPMMLTLPVLAGGLVALAATEWLLGVVPRRHTVTTLLAIGVVSGIGAVITVPDLATQALRLAPSGGSATVGEVQPMLWPSLQFSLRPLWDNFTTAAFLAVPGLAMLAMAAWRDQSPAKRLVLIWSIAIIAATLAQVRFGYYMAIAVAMLASIAAARWLWRGLDMRIATLVVAAIVIYPNAVRVRDVAASPNLAPTASWLEALDWMRASTPQPFNDAGDYYARYVSAATAPRPKYSVMVWWDYAWWVARIAQRPPATNPTQVAVKEAGRFYLATTEADAMAILEERKAGYVIADRSIPMSTATAGHAASSQLELMARWSDRYETSQFYDLYYERGTPVFVYTPDYYRTMGIRMFAYGGRSYTPSRASWAITVDANRQIVEKRVFNTYAEAETFVAADARTWRLVGLHPLLGPSPVEALTIVEREFSSTAGVDGPIGRIPDVSVFRVLAAVSTLERPTNTRKLQ